MEKKRSKLLNVISKISKRLGLNLIVRSSDRSLENKELRIGSIWIPLMYCSCCTAVFIWVVLDHIK